MRLRVLVLLPCLTLLSAQDPAAGAAAAGPTPASPPAPTPADGVSGTFGVDFTTAYFFRGIRQEDKGVIAQPHFELDFKLCADEGVLHSLDLVLGQWNSLHDGPTGSGGTAQSMWYESDFYATLRAGLGERWSVDSTYTTYYSPNARFRTVEEIAFGLAYNDDGQLGEGFAGLQPSVRLAFELDGQADAGTHLGTYAQLALAPSLELGKAGAYDFKLALPLIAAFSLGDYYQDAAGKDHTFGYLDIGCVLSSPLPFLPSRLGPWTASLGLHGLFLGPSNEQVNNGDDFELIGTFGLSTTF
jgi:hypothetical protein